MLDHVGLNVSDYEASKAFYLQALAPLGIAAVMDFPEWKSLGLGDGQKPYLWIHERGAPSTSTHVAVRPEPMRTKPVAQPHVYPPAEFVHVFDALRSLPHAVGLLHSLTSLQVPPVGELVYPAGQAHV